MKLETKLGHRWINDFVEQQKKLGKIVFYFKIHGHSMQMKGLPDYILCIDGQMIGVEFKVCSRLLTPTQENVAKWMRNAGARYWVLTFTKEGIAYETKKQIL